MTSCSPAASARGFITRRLPCRCSAYHCGLRYCGSFGFGGNLEFGPGRHGQGMRCSDISAIRMGTASKCSTRITDDGHREEPVRWDLYMRNRPWDFRPANVVRGGFALQGAAPRGREKGNR